MNAHKKIILVYMSIMMSTCIFGLAVYFAIPVERGLETDPGILLYVTIACCVGGTLGGMFLYNTRIQKVQDASAAEKLEALKIATILRIALLEGPALLSMVCYMLYGGNVFLYIWIGMLAIMGFFFPSRRRVQEELQITDEEFIAL